jgi:hypothetical protein
MHKPHDRGEKYVLLLREKTKIPKELSHSGMEINVWSKDVGGLRPPKVLKNMI